MDPPDTPSWQGLCIRSQELEVDGRHITKTWGASSRAHEQLSTD
jgi:hypothetical protein